MREFSREGIAGARTDAIARSATSTRPCSITISRTKKRFTALCSTSFGGLSAHRGSAFQRSAAERKVAGLRGRHYDYIASHPAYRRIVQSEMMRAGRGKAPHLKRIAKQYFEPLFSRVGSVIEQGMASGEFRPVDPTDFVPSMIAVIVFISAMRPSFAWSQGLIRCLLDVSLPGARRSWTSSPRPCSGRETNSQGARK